MKSAPHEWVEAGAYVLASAFGAFCLYAMFRQPVNRVVADYRNAVADWWHQPAPLRGPQKWVRDVAAAVKAANECA